MNQSFENLEFVPEIKNDKNDCTQLNIPDNLSEMQKKQWKDILKAHSHIFTDKPGYTQCIQHDIQLIDPSSIISKPYHVPFTQRKF